MGRGREKTCRLWDRDSDVKGLISDGRSPQFFMRRHQYLDPSTPLATLLGALSRHRTESRFRKEIHVNSKK